MKRRLRPWVRVVIGLVPLLGLSALSPSSEEPESPGTLAEPEEEVRRFPEEAKAVNPKGLAEWRALNPDVKYVLTFADENEERIIPVIAAKDASYALKHNLHGEEDSMGSVFCDPSGVSPENLVVYGHSSKTKDRCFTFLRNYVNPAYYRAHPTILLEEDAGMRTCQIVSAAVYDMNQDVYVGWADSTLSGAEEINSMFRDTVPYLVNHTEGKVYEGGGVLTLVTCDMSKSDARIVLQALCEG